ncbi:PIN domain-containing protein [Oricola sp.]|uniref:PIN domain-containing protein n=1 Tax=Oricola sp. TaxID=1979950 RepID=UPI003BABA692
MIGVDTNVLLRFLVEDDNAAQRSAAIRFMRERSADDPAYIGLVTLAETIWVLRKRLRYPWERIRQSFALLLDSSDFVFAEHDRLVILLDDSSAPGCDPADYLIAWANERAGCSATVTFDRDAAKSIATMEFLR